MVIWRSCLFVAREDPRFILPALHEFQTPGPHAAMDIVFIHGLKVDAVIGIWDWERQFKQTLVIDLDLGTDISAAAASESITDTIDYKSVSKRVAQVAEEGAFQLVETLAQRIAELLLGEFGRPWVRVKVNKRSAVRTARDVGVIIERSRPA